LKETKKVIIFVAVECLKYGNKQETYIKTIFNNSVVLNRKPVVKCRTHFARVFLFRDGGDKKKLKK